MNEENAIVINLMEYNRMVIRDYDYRRLMDTIRRLTHRRPNYVDIDSSALAKYMMQAFPEFRAYVESLEEIPWNFEEKKEEEA